jgi:hypothetical protein
MGVLQDDWLDGQLPRATGNQQVSGSNDSEASGGGGGRTWLPWAASSPALLLDKECCIGPPDVCVCFLHFSSLERDSFGWRAPDLLRGSVAFDIVGVTKGVTVKGCTYASGEDLFAEGIRPAVQRCASRGAARHHGDCIELMHSCHGRCSSLDWGPLHHSQRQ